MPIHRKNVSTNEQTAFVIIDSSLILMSTMISLGKISKKRQQKKRFATPLSTAIESVSKQPTCCQVGFLWHRHIYHTIKNQHLTNQNQSNGLPFTGRTQLSCCFTLPVAEKLPWKLL